MRSALSLYVLVVALVLALVSQVWDVVQSAEGLAL